VITFVFFNAFNKEMGRATGSIGDDIEIPHGSVFFTIENVTTEDIVERAIYKMNINSAYPRDILS
jgi:hypothetical protein